MKRCIKSMANEKELERINCLEQKQNLTVDDYEELMNITETLTYRLLDELEVQY